MLLRLQYGRARKIAGGSLPPAPSERRVEWRPSPDDRRAHPELPADAVIRGRLIEGQVEGQNGKVGELYLFTTLEEALEKLVELYGRRWNIELDIRSLKQSLRLHSLSSQSPQGVAKELLMAIAGYNLVRSIQVAAPRKANLKPRQLSFSGGRRTALTPCPPWPRPPDRRKVKRESH